MANNFRASVVTPEACVFEQPITAAVVPTFDGMHGILNQHAPLLTKLSAGVLRLQAAAGEEKFFVSGGYAQMLDNQLTILAEQAVPANALTAEFLAAEQAKADAMPSANPADILRRQAAADRLKAMRLAIDALR